MRRAEGVVLGLLAMAGVAAIMFVIAYALEWSTQILGLSLGASLVLIAAALIVAGKRVAPGEVVAEERPGLGDEGEQLALAEDIEQGGKGVSRRGVLLGGAAATGAALSAALIIPAASLGPKPGDRIGASPWRRGTSVLDEQGVHLAPRDIELGGFVTGYPEGADPRELGSPIVLVKLRPEELDLPADRSDWDAEGVLAFSKICTHAGCTINLFRYPLYEPQSPGPALVCPCHYSTFDVTTGGNRIFGPAGRALPQLPLDLDGEGRLIAGGEFSGAIGPSWWGVRRQNS
jgi:ubiquinol-cytochrome c reductase iron-sulfur subunit